MKFIMKILICASKHNYGYIADIKKKLESMGHGVMVPNSYDEPMKEEEIKKFGKEEHHKWKKDRRCNIFGDFQSF